EHGCGRLVRKYQGPRTKDQKRKRSFWYLVLGTWHLLLTDSSAKRKNRRRAGSHPPAPVYAARRLFSSGQPRFPPVQGPCGLNPAKGEQRRVSAVGKRSCASGFSGACPEME